MECGERKIACIKNPDGAGNEGDGRKTWAIAT